MNNKNKSFTLIELLVVIVIIGILAGVIMISTSSSIDKANFAKAQAFSSTVQNELLSNLVSEWTFDNSSNIGEDTWGNNNGTLYGAAGSQNLPQLQSASKCVFGTCLKFDGVDDYIDFGNSDSLNIEDTITISLWIKGAGVALAKGGEPETYSVGVKSNKAFFYRERLDGANEYLDGALSLNPNNWNHLLFVDNGALMKVYINSILDSNTHNSSGWSAGTDLSSVYVGKGDISGSECAEAGFLNGSIDEVRIYNNFSPSISQIKQNYIAGLNSMLANGNISKEDYNERINNLAYNDNNE